MFAVLRCRSVVWVCGFRTLPGEKLLKRSFPHTRPSSLRRAGSPRQIRGRRSRTKTGPRMPHPRIVGSRRLCQSVDTKSKYCHHPRAFTLRRSQFQKSREAKTSTNNEIRECRAVNAVEATDLHSRELGNLYRERLILYLPGRQIAHYEKSS
jgi:hypothetical protein